MNRVAILTFVLAAFIGRIAAQCTVTTVTGSHAPSTFCAGDLIFSDEFDAPSIDFTKWEHESTLAGGGNWEFQWYTNNRSNSFQRDGVLYIKPTLTSEVLGGEAGLGSSVVNINGGAPADYCTNAGNWGCERTGTPTNIINPIRSARMRTTYSFNFKYGRVVVRAKVPSGDWLWPAIWMMPRYNAYGGWPTSGEIDIMESRGNPSLMLNGENIGNTMVGQTLHWGADYFTNQYPRTHWEVSNAASFAADFHDYEVVWNPDGITFLVDGAVVGAIQPPAGGFWELGELANTGYSNPWVGQDKMAPFNSEFYLIFNVAVGGTAYFPDEAVNPTPKPWSNTSPQASTDFWNGRNDWLPTWQLNENDNAALQIDYVRIYAV